MLKTFSIGGVHPHENKLSAHQPIVQAEIPAKAVILLGQHIGAPAKPIVAKGDVVKVGTKIAEPGGFVSAAIHSSVSGKVAKIDTVVDASGYAKPAIFIDVEGDEWEESIDRTETLVKECNLTAEEIVKKIADAGIVGLGGACFPTQVKLCPPPAFKAECVIINAVECEPYLTADHQLMLEHAEEIMVGVSILMKAVKVNKAFIGIENNKPDAIQLMTKVASGYAGIEVVPLKVQYPQGGEKQLIDLKDLRGKYVLLSFWASYDAPSRVQNATLNHAIEQADNVEMVSVSFDEFKSIFNETIKKDRISTSNCFVELAGNSSDLFKTYRLNKGFKNFLLDKNGVIVAKDITPSQLSSYLN